MRARVNVPRLVMFARYYTTPELERFLDQFVVAEAELDARMRDIRIKSLYRRRARTTLRTVTKERKTIERELENRPDEPSEFEES